MVGFDTLNFQTYYNAKKICELSETPPVFFSPNSFFCQIKNYRAEYKNGLLTFIGSIQKAVDGQNVHCSISQQYEYIVGLLDYLGLDFSVRVKRYDIATTIETETPPPVFLKSLGELPGRQKRISGDKHPSIYFDKYTPKFSTKNGRTEEVKNTLLFYDKGYESGLKGNLLRCEYREMRPRSYVTLKQIFDGFKISCQLINKEINKINFINNEIMKANTKTELNKVFTLYAIKEAQATAPNFVEDTIEKMRLTSGADNREFRRFKTELEETLKNQIGVNSENVKNSVKKAFEIDL